jgi:hypothetical protein
MTRMSAAKALLLAMPLAVLVVPQGTVERSLIPELSFVVFMLLTLTIAMAQASWERPAFSVPVRLFNPLLLVSLLFLLLFNPIWSLQQGNQLGRIVMTALPFTMLGVFWLFALVRPNAAEVRLLLASCGVAGTLLACAVIGNFFIGDTSYSAMRSTGIEGRRSLSLPALPMGAVITFALSLSSPSKAQRRRWGLMTLICATAVLMTVTRAMLLSFLLGCLVTFFLIYRHADTPTRRSIGRALVLGLIVTIAMGAPMLGSWLDRLDPASEGDVGTILGRFDEYSAFLEGFAASPLLGQGMGHVFTYPSDFDWTLRDSGITVCHSHLFFILGTCGIVGAGLYYALLASTLWRLLRNAGLRHLDITSTGALAGAAGSLVTGVVFTLTSTTFTALSYNIVLAVLMLVARTRWDHAAPLLEAPRKDPS